MAVVPEKELERLGRSLVLPVAHFGRRTVRIELVSASALRVYEAVEVLVADQPPEDPIAVSQRIVSAGLFSKEYRLPDLKVSHRGGRAAVYARNDREALLGALFLSRFEYDLGLEEGVFPNERMADYYAIDRQLTEEQLLEVLRLVGRIHTAAPPKARATLRELQRRMSEMGLHWLAWRPEFYGELLHLAEEAQLLVEVRALPGETVVLELEYTVPSKAARSWRDFEFGDRAPRAWPRPLRAFLRLIGVTPWAVRLEMPAADHCESFHVIVDSTEPVSVEDIYWEELPAPPSADRDIETHFQRGESVWLARRWDDFDSGIRRVKPVIWFGVHALTKQMALVAFAVTFLTAYVVSKVAASPGTLEDVSARSFLVTLPGLLTAAVSQTRGGSRVGYGTIPRVLLYVVAAIPFMVAVVQLFGGPPDPEVISRYGAALATLVSGVFLVAGVTPRSPIRGRRFESIRDRRAFYRRRDILAMVGIALALAVSFWVFAASGPAVPEGESDTSDEIAALER